VLQRRLLDRLDLPTIGAALALSAVGLTAIASAPSQQPGRAGLWKTQLAWLGIAAVAAVLSNVVNNLPAVLVLLPLVTSSGPAAVLAVLIGVNVGPNLTYVGSLANLLWRSVVRRDIRAGFVEFTRIGLLTTPITLVIAVLGLWVGIRFFGV